jgi:3-hydroxyisobutyrate dehydrogenase-like beta-hydroxyacid dehydrogenase
MAVMAQGQQDIGILHPGAMGSRVAEQAAAAGAEVWWLPSGRGAASVARAEAAGLRRAGSLAELAERCHIVLSVCPPAAALDVARSVADVSFSGIYVDANAISPQHTLEIAGLFESTEATVVDGGIVGGPPRKPGTRLYLSGDDPAAVDAVRALFAPTVLEPIVLPGPIGRASALKLSFAAFNKISSALAAQSYALAAGHGVLDELLALASDVLPGSALARPGQVATAGPRAWRWAPEMEEIAAACAGVGVPGDLATAAARLFARWADLKDADEVTVADLIARWSADHLG